MQHGVTIFVKVSASVADFATKSREQTTEKYVELDVNNALFYWCFSAGIYTELRNETIHIIPANPN